MPPAPVEPTEPVAPPGLAPTPTPVELPAPRPVEPEEPLVSLPPLLSPPPPPGWVLPTLPRALSLVFMPVSPAPPFAPTLVSTPVVPPVCAHAPPVASRARVAAVAKIRLIMSIPLELFFTAGRERCIRLLRPVPRQRLDRIKDSDERFVIAAPRGLAGVEPRRWRPPPAGCAQNFNHFRRITGRSSAFVAMSPCRKITAPNQSVPSPPAARPRPARRSPRPS